MSESYGTVAVVYGRQVGTAGTQLQFIIQTLGAKSLMLDFVSSGGNFASQNATLEGSSDNTNFTPTQNIGLGTGTEKTQLLAEGTLIGGVHFTLYRFVRITVPALGAEISCTVIYGGK